MENKNRISTEPAEEHELKIVIGLDGTTFFVDGETVDAQAFGKYWPPKGKSGEEKDPFIRELLKGLPERRAIDS